MTSHSRSVTRTLVACLLVVACASASTSPDTPPGSASPDPSSSPVGGTERPTADPSLPASPSAVPEASASGDAPATPPVSTRTAELPVRGSARELSSRPVLLAPAIGLVKGLYMLIPNRQAPATLALVDGSGTPRPGWPISLPDVVSCDQLLPVADGSVRAICTLENPQGNMYDPQQAVAFDGRGNQLAGWPVELFGNDRDAVVIGDDLVMFHRVPLGDLIPDGQPASRDLVQTIKADGRVVVGAWDAADWPCCAGVWAISPEGVAIGVEWTTEDPSGSLITALDARGERDGRLAVTGVASRPAFGPGAQPILLTGSPERGTSRVLAVDPESVTVAARSAVLPWRSVEPSGDTGGCSSLRPLRPVVGPEGTTVLVSELDPAIQALDATLATRDGWPFVPPGALARARPGLESEHEAGYCPDPVRPVVGPDGTVYLAIEARSSTVGGRLVAVAPDGRVRSGWPVELTRAGAEFWAVGVSAGGTVHALAIEPEPGGRSSATVLFIDPDSTVRASATIIEPD